VLRPIGSADDFRPGEDGITLRKGDHYGLFLPEVATQMGWDRETTLSQLALKAGLKADDWREETAFEVFNTIHYQAPYPSGPVGLASHEASPAADHGAAPP
jgi:AMMECR1 domain-containing protein